MAGSIFVTGAGGFLGRRVVARLTESENRKLVCLIREKPADGSPSNVQFVRGDLLDPQGYADALVGCDTVVHLAAATGKCPPTEFTQVNREGTLYLVDAATRVGISRFIFVSTIAVTFRDISGYYYAQSKQQAEAVVTRSGLNWTVVRPTMILGKNAPVLQGLSKLASLPILPVFGHGRVPVQPVFVDDLANCLTAMLCLEGLNRQTIEIGGPEVLGIEQLLQRIRCSLGKGEAPACHLPLRPIVACLRRVEALARPLLPFTAGQLASFSNPGTAREHPWTAAWQTQMMGVDEMLRSAANRT
jgi:nucleoside-diphosphate-sugar epimerase